MKMRFEHFKELIGYLQSAATPLVQKTMIQQGKIRSQTNIQPTVNAIPQFKEWVEQREKTVKGYPSELNTRNITTEGNVVEEEKPPKKPPRDKKNESSSNKDKEKEKKTKDKEKTKRQRDDTINSPLQRPQHDNVPEVAPTHRV